jgi:hypothetical protein
MRSRAQEINASNAIIDAYLSKKQDPSTEIKSGSDSSPQSTRG